MLLLLLLMLLAGGELSAKQANLYRIEGDTVHFFLSADDGLKVGQTLYVVRGKTVIAEVKVTSVGPFASQGAVSWKEEGITLTPSDVVKDKLQGEKRSPRTGATPSDTPPPDRPAAATGASPAASSTPDADGKPQAASAASSAKTDGKVLLVVRETVLVNLGSFHGVAKGDRLKITRAGKEIGELEIVEVGTYHAVGKVALKEAVRRGDTAAKGG